jgi:hypothetical protein
VQNIVEEALTADAPVISAIVVGWFLLDGMTDPHVFYGSGGDEEPERRITKLIPAWPVSAPTRGWTWPGPTGTWTRRRLGRVHRIRIPRSDVERRLTRSTDGQKINPNNQKD